MKRRKKINTKRKGFVSFYIILFNVTAVVQNNNCKGYGPGNEK